MNLGAFVIPEGEPVTTARYELKITAEGELRDADGRLLDKDGKPVEPDPAPDEPEQETEE